MIRAAIIDTISKKIVTVVEYDTMPPNPPPGFDDSHIAVANEKVGPEWTWDGSSLIAPIQPPVAAVVPLAISDRQFFQQLAILGIITQDDALASNAAVIPPPLMKIIETMPADQQFSAKMIVSGATTYYRNDPLTISIGEAYGWNADQIDAFFQAAAAL